MKGGVFLSYSEEIIRHIQSYLPGKDHVFVAGVSLTWRECYKSKSSSCLTSYSSVVVSPSRMKNALEIDSGTYKSLCEYSCTSGSVEALRWLCSPRVVNVFGSGTRGPTLEMAASGGTNILNIVLGAFDHDTRGVWVQYQILMGSIRSGDVTMVEMWSRNLMPLTWPDEICEKAGSHGSVEVLEWALDKGCINKNSSVIVHAARNSRLDVLRWCIPRGIRRGIFQVYEEAARKGDLGILKAIRSMDNLQGITTLGSSVITARAASTGKIEVLSWALEEGYPFGPEAYICAARSSHHATQEVVIQCLELISRVIDPRNLWWMISMIECDAEEFGITNYTLDWLRARASASVSH